MFEALVAAAVSEEAPVPVARVIALVVELERLYVEVTAATTCETVIVLVMVAVLVTVVVEVVEEESARARRGRRVERRRVVSRIVIQDFFSLCRFD